MYLAPFTAMLATANNIDFSLKKDEDKKEDYNSIENDE
jgi:hypothetical protein